MADLIAMMAAAAGASAEAGDYEISRSLRFNSADSAYLARTPGTAGDRKTWTWSGWVKRSTLNSSGEKAIFIVGTSLAEGTYFNIAFSSDKLVCGTGAAELRGTTAVYRDVSSWYHIVIAVDTTQATAANRVKVYVNGSEVTSFSSSADPTLDLDTAVNSTVAHNIGRNSWNSSNYFDGYLADVFLIDGQALTPSSFGETDAVTGVWKPIAYAGTYGTNGFYLPFSNNTSTTTLGYDAAGSNDWTLNNFSVAAGAGNDSLVDSPTRYGTDTGAGGTVRGNYCTLNPLTGTNSIIVNNGNLYTQVASGSTGVIRSTLMNNSGKWYFEATLTKTTNGLSAIGVVLDSQSIVTPNSLATVPAGMWLWRDDAYKVNNGVGSSYGTQASSGDTIMVAYDADAGKIWFGRQGSWFASGDPAAGTNEAFSGLTTSIGPCVNFQGASGDPSFTVNFGQRPFAYTAPSGFKALCTTNLTDPTVVQGDDYFNTVLYTGTGSSLGVTGVGFQPDFVWIKERSGAADHGLYDAVRGVTKQLESNTTTAETTEATGLTAFGSDGFTVGSLAQLNTSADTYVAWNWNAGGSNATNTDGTITSTVRANTTAGFSIVTYTGTGVDATVGHGLGSALKFLIVKRLDSAASWFVWANSFSVNDFMTLQTTDAIQNVGDVVWDGANPTSTVFSVGTNGGVNGSTLPYIAYCFAEVEGFSKFGSYTGNGSTNGPFIYTGFRPAWVMIKRTDVSANWNILDSARDSYNLAQKNLKASSSDAENPNWGNYQDFLSNGSKIRSTDGDVNASNGTYIYAAFAENPFKNSLAR